MKDGCPPVNITKMTDDEYYAWAVHFEIFQLKNELLDAYIEPLNDNTVNVSGICPHCGKRVCYHHYRSVFNLQAQPCPVCNEPSIVNPIAHCNFESMNRKAAALINGQRAAVWAVNAANFYWLLEAMPVLQTHDVYFVNQNKPVIPQSGKAVSALGGKPVYTPGILLEQGIETVLVPNNPVVYRDIQTRCAGDYPAVKNIIHITALM
jgi:uncharacterized CHY-type Zn-finger protein